MRVLFSTIFSTYLLLVTMTATAQSVGSGESSDAGGDSAFAYLGNIAFWVSDFDAMRKFYSDVVGVPEAGTGEKPRRWVFYNHEGFSFSLLKSDDLVPERKGWTRCPMPGSTGENWRPYVTFYVSDLRAVINRCKAAGVVVRTEEPFTLGQGFGESIEVMDPDGNAVALTQRP